MAKKLSRRDFLKGTAATVAGAAALGLMGSMPAAQAQAEEAEEEFLTAEAYANKKWKFEVMPKEYPIADEKISKVFTNEIVVVGSGGMGGDIKVTVTIEGGKITDIAYEANETPGIGDAALPELVQQAIASGGAVDGVSGASMTTAAFSAAVADALSKAMA